MKNYINDLDIPMGLGMALAQNVPAMNYFSSLSPNKQREIINGTHSIKSKEEMHTYVDNLVNQFGN